MTAPDDLLGLLRSVRRGLWVRDLLTRAVRLATLLVVLLGASALVHLAVRPLPGTAILRASWLALPLILGAAALTTRPTLDRAAREADRLYEGAEVFTSALEQLLRRPTDRAGAAGFVLAQARRLASQCGPYPPQPALAQAGRLLVLLLIGTAAASGLFLPGASSRSSVARAERQPSPAAVAATPSGTLARDLRRALSASSTEAGVKRGDVDRGGTQRRPSSEQEERLAEPAGEGRLPIPDRLTHQAEASGATAGWAVAGSSAGKGKEAGAGSPATWEPGSSSPAAVRARFIEIPLHVQRASGGESSGGDGPGIVEFGYARGRPRAAVAAIIEPPLPQPYLEPVLRAYAARYFELTGVRK